MEPHTVGERVHLLLAAAVCIERASSLLRFTSRYTTVCSTEEEEYFGLMLSFFSSLLFFHGRRLRYTISYGEKSSFYGLHVLFFFSFFF